jgi:hypothetical protein
MDLVRYIPAPAYILGWACVSRGLMGIYSPRDEYHHVGLPLESRSPTSGAGDDGVASPAMYFKGIREVTIGMTLALLQHQGNHDGVTTFAAIVSLARFADGLVVWLHGGDKLRYRAWGHWITGATFVGWVFWRRSH